MEYEYALYWLLGTLATALTAFVVVRLGSLGYFRSKREHFDWVRREIGGDDGEEG